MGVSAIAIASLAIADLERTGWHGQIRKGRRLGTSNIGTIHGGEATNVVTDRVAIRAEARSHDPTFRKRIVREIERALARVYSGEGDTAEQQQLDPREQVKKMILDRDSLLMAADGDPRKFYELAATIDEFIDEIFRQATE